LAESAIVLRHLSPAAASAAIRGSLLACLDAYNTSLVSIRYDESAQPQGPADRQHDFSKNQMAAVFHIKTCLYVYCEMPARLLRERPKPPGIRRQ
jgi:hypothetical protein